MQEDQTTTSGENKHSAPAASLLGMISLVLVFIVAASLTWTYLANASSQTAAATTAILAKKNILPAPLNTDAFKSVTLTAKSAIVIDETTGQIFYALHPDAQWPLASLTKVALILSIGQVMPPDTVITIPFSSGYNPRGGTLRKGELWRLQDVIDFTIAISSNRGADILAAVANDAIHRAYPLSPPLNATLWRMNDLAKSLGLTRTYFLNDNGLDESTTLSGAYGSARDIASLLDYAVKTMPARFAATTKRTFTVSSVDGTHVDAINTDEALPDIPNVILGKTGYTDLAGGNLALCYKEKNDVICTVVLGSTFYGRFSDMKSLVSATQRTFASP